MKKAPVIRVLFSCTLNPYTPAMRSYTILGTGALGGYYGSLLARAGNTTRFILRSDLEHARQHGLKVDSINGSFHLPQIDAYAITDNVPVSDVVIICTKTTSNDQLRDMLTPLVSEHTHVLVLQNGLQPETQAAAIVGDDRVLGGLCFLCSNKVGPGHIHHLDYGPIDMGLHAPKIDGNLPARRELLKQIVADFNAAGITTRAVDDLREARWRKLVWNVPYNGLSVALGQDTAQIMSDIATVKRVKRIMQEVVATALASEGIALREDFVESRLENTRKMRPYKTSMMLDHQTGRPLEHESIIGDVVRAAKSAGVSIPETTDLYIQLCETCSQ